MNAPTDSKSTPNDSKPTQKDQNDQYENECCICLEKINLPITIPCKHKFCYLCLKRSYQHNSACPLCRSTIPGYVISNAKLEQKVEFSGIVWLYSGRNNGWWSYDPTMIEQVEQAYKQGDEEYSFELLGQKYVIDFDTMHQIQIASGVKRFVRRLDKSQIEQEVLKGIAGLKL